MMMMMSNFIMIFLLFLTPNRSNSYYREVRNKPKKSYDVIFRSGNMVRTIRE